MLLGRCERYDGARMGGWMAGWVRGSWSSSRMQKRGEVITMSMVGFQGGNIRESVLGVIVDGLKGPWGSEPEIKVPKP